MNNEINEIRTRYERRSLKAQSEKKDRNWPFSYFVQSEREFIYAKIIRNLFNSCNDIKIIEIGAGNGSNLLFFHRLGIPFPNIYANELLENRGVILKKNLPTPNIYIGNACELKYNEEFDIVFQSTVFTSILDYEFKKKLADRMWEMVKSTGIILWYDFKYNNPNNRDVKGIDKKEIKMLFPLAKDIEFYNVTLAPPIGRRIGKLYNILNFFLPFLRTHLIAVIKK